MQLPTDIETFISNVAGNTTTNIEAFVSATVNVSGMFAGAIMFIYVTHKIVVSFLKPNEPINPSTLVRPILILIAIVLYQDLIEVLVDPAFVILNDIVEHGATSAGASGYKTNAQNVLEHIQSTGGVGGAGIFDLLAVNPFLELVHLLIFFIAVVCVAYITFKQLIMKSMYYILGIMVLPFSLIPGNEKALNKWFFGYLSVLLWIPLLNVMMFLINAVDYTGNVFTNPIFSIAFQVMIIFLILNVPKYANIIVGGEGSEAGVANAVKKLPGRMYGGAKLAGKAAKAMSGKK